MKVPYNDLTRIHTTELKQKFHEHLDTVIDTSAFVGHSKEFENAVITGTGTKHCVPCKSGTDALYLAIRSLGLAPDSKITVPAMTFAATAMSVVNAGHVPVFIDVDPETGLMLVDEVVKTECECIIPVHLYGQCVDVRPLVATGIPVIEDCAQAYGSTIDGKHVGTFGKIGCFSFYPGKNLGALGDGGACITNDPELATTLTQLTKLGANPLDRYDHQIIGSKSTMDNLQSLFLAEKLKHIDRWTDERIRLGKHYCDALSGVPNRSTIGKDVYHVYYTLQKDRANYINYMNEKGVQTNIQYPIALTKQTCFLPYVTGPCPNAEGFSAKCVSIPLFPGMTSEEVEFTLTCHRGYCLDFD